MTRPEKIRKLANIFEFLLKDSADLFIMFVDMCGSTLFKQTCSDQGFPETTWIIRQLLFLQRVAEIIESYKGIVIKTLGDEVISIFPSTTTPENILNCAIEIIQSFENFKPYQGKSRIESKISIDFGLTYNGSITKMIPFDPIGTPVDRCARLNALTQKNEISFSQDFLTALQMRSSDAQLKAKYDYKTRDELLKGLGVNPVHSIKTI